MQYVDEDRLEDDVEYRFAYMADYLEFGDEDVRALHEVAPRLLPMIPSLCDSVYAKLHAYDATWRRLLPGGGARDFGTALERRLADLSPDHAIVQTRKHHLGRYFVRLLTKPYDAAMVQYLYAMGRMHQARTHANRADVPLVHMNAYLAHVSDGVTALICSLGLEISAQTAVLRAWNKVMWLQGDLVAHYYLQGATA